MYIYIYTYIYHISCIIYHISYIIYISYIMYHVSYIIYHIYIHRIWCGQLISSHLLRRRYVAEVSLGRVTAWALGSSWRSSGLLWKSQTSLDDYDGFCYQELLIPIYIYSIIIDDDDDGDGDGDDDKDEESTYVGMLLDHPRSRGSRKSFEDVWAPRMVALQVVNTMQYSHFGQEKKQPKNTSGLFSSVVASSCGRFESSRNLEGPACCRRRAEFQ